MNLATIVRVSGGRIGTICWHHLDGYGGVWGKSDFSHIEPGFSEELPAPEFMLREKSVEALLRKQSPFGGNHRPDVECVGEDCEILDAETVGLTCKHGYEYPSEGPDGPWDCNADGSNPNCPNCSPDAWQGGDAA